LECQAVLGFVQSMSYVSWSFDLDMSELVMLAPKDL